MPHYPSQQDLQGTDKLERVIRDLYDYIYALEAKIQNLQSSSNTKPVEQQVLGSRSVANSGQKLRMGPIQG